MFALAKIFISLILARKKTHFLVVLQNNNELRATGGFITKVVDILCGKFRAKPTFRDVFKELTNHAPVKPPAPLGDMLADRNFNSWTLRDANYEPDFNKSAKKIIEFYNLVHPINKVKGVMAINFSFIENLLGIAGPLKMDDFEITKNNLFMYLSSKASDIDRHDHDSIKKRKDALKIIYKILIKKCIFSIHKWGKINKLIKESLENKDLQLWQENKSSTFNYNDHDDCLAVIDSNFLGGKSNRYIKRTIERKVEFTKNNAKVQLDISWENLGKSNYPLSTRYRGFTRIYISLNKLILMSLSPKKTALKL